MSFSPDFNWHTFRHSGFKITKNIEEINSYFYDSSVKARVGSRSVHYRGPSEDSSKDPRQNYYNGFRNEVRKAVISLKKSPVRLEKLPTFALRKNDLRSTIDLNDDELQVKRFIDAMVSNEPSVFRKAGFTAERQTIDIASADKIIKEAKKIVKHGVRRKNPKTGLGSIIQDFWTNHISKDQVIRWDSFEDSFLAYIKNYMATEIGILSRLNWQKFIQKFFQKFSKETTQGFIWTSCPSFPVLEKRTQKTLSLNDFSKAIQTLDMVFLMFSCIDETPSPMVQKVNDVVYTYACGCRYKGQWHDRIRDGVGLLEMCNKETYNGIFAEGKFHDFGALAGNEFSYKGFFRKGVPHGFGKMIYPNSSYFEGLFEKGVQVNGNVRFSDGTSYNGELVNCCFEGRGVMHLENEEVRSGMWHCGKLHGEGKISCPDKVLKGVFIDGQLITGSVKTEDYKYKGEFFNETPHGNGEFKYKSGESYQGNLQLGVYEGYGKLTSPGGETYEGSFRSGQKEGFGKLHYSSGAEYSGQFLQGLPHGEGRFSHLTPTIIDYEGQVAEGKLEGEGRATFNDGSKYSGQFSQNLITGKGKLVSGKFTYIGEFLNFKFHGIGELRYETCYYSGTWINNLPNGTGDAKDAFGNFYSGSFSQGAPTAKHKLSVEFLKVLQRFKDV